MKLKCTVFILLIMTCFMYGQKKPLDHSVYDSWQNIGSRKITNDGKWIAYSVDVQEGNSNLFLYSVKNKTSRKFERATKVNLTGDSRFAVFQIRPLYKDIKAVKDKKLKKNKLTKDSLAIVDFLNGQTEKIPNVKTFKIPEKSGSYVAYLLENTKDKSSDDASDKEDGDDKQDDKNEKPLQLVVRNLLNGKNTTYDNVIRYEFSKNGKQLAFVTKKPDEKKDKKQGKESTEDKSDDKKETDKSKPKKYALQTVQVIDLQRGTVMKASEMEGDFSQLSFDEEGNQLAFVGTSSAQNDLVKLYQLYYFNFKGNKKEIVTNDNTQMKKNWVISENRLPLFSKNGKQLYFGVAPKPIAKDTAMIANDHAVVDIWNYKDDYLQTIQLKELKNDLKKSYAAVMQTEKPDSFRNIDGEDLDTLRWVNEGNAEFALGITSLNNRIPSQWEGATKKTYFLINNKTGERTEVVKNLNGSVEVSPLGNYVVIFDKEKGKWLSYNVKTKQTLPLNDGLSVSFVDEEFDMPDFPSSYGIASWTNNDESVIIRDRYDLWEFFLKGSKKPRNITNGFGRKNKITFDTYDLDEDIKSLNRKSSIYLSAFDNTSKANGIFKTSIQSNVDPVKIQMENVWGYRNLQKAKNAEEYILVKESYTDSPNIFVTSDFSEQQKLSKTNPQQNLYNWGTDELVHWTTPKGNTSTGVLYKPEDFNPNKKYPMIVYFYEKLSDNLNRYVAPAPTPSRLNISYFVSNGYLVFTPDISYTDGFPGESAMEYINSGVEKLKQNSWVDGTKIGIQGQSWGGYQVAYLIAHTNMYAAAWSGAPVVNMTSAYGGIRWTSGMNRQFQYEKSQSRLGKNLWEAPELYIKNSPLFTIDKVKTPVVIMSNDQDGAVPWYQGIEMFTALRRLGKPVWLLNYNGDDHNLVKRQNRKDIQIREQQFFDYYLKGAKAPVWMTKGVPATQKGKNWGFELTDEKPN
ncbi:S9 family peptidase [Chryseobacterium indologenes]|uniref:alpha/beta hydrolase family protein n=1 Tax=Chryseobacterium indologenes TaxID=253 RepID=UPI0004B6FE0E|nr:prolyl oligopeptidase family serine peptidase [Chryseobacterium indologenes]QPQ52649.1 S9 family peptidase [Chryseobacterium indologenes]SFJ77295.1 WD40-like Beta Propeller Repeat [Chryseobacterium indologenes]SUX51349.1 Prolyl tripeptidyl peptidase precursor [Chryseobacterium indologenes]